MVDDVTVFEGIISFMRSLGFFKVVLPFLLTFALVYAILDKTMVLGVEHGTKDEPKRSLNAIIAFCVALFVVGSTRVVALINEALANIVVVILLLVFFLATVSVFMKDGGTFDFTKEHKWVFVSLVVAVFIVFLLIFLAAIGWLEPTWNWLRANWNEDYVATIIFLIGISVFIGFLVRPEKPARSE